VTETRQLNIAIDANHHKSLKLLAAEMDTTITSIVRTAVKVHLKKIQGSDLNNLVLKTQKTT